MLRVLTYIFYSSYFERNKIMKIASCSALAVAAITFFSVSAHAQSLVNSAASYEQCLDDAAGNNIKMTTCTVNETARIVKILEGKYEQMANSEQFKNWNRGAGMFNGNFKDLYSAWLQYRDKYCSLYGYSMSADVDVGNIAQLAGAECILELTKRQNKDMDVILQNISKY